MNIICKGRNGSFEAKGTVEDGIITVKKGSTISKDIKKIGKKVEKIRTDSSIVGSNYVVKKDVTFTSASLAAQFVVGYITNGLVSWKLENGDTLGTVLEGKGRKGKTK